MPAEIGKKALAGPCADETGLGFISQNEGGCNVDEYSGQVSSLWPGSLRE